MPPKLIPLTIGGAIRKLREVEAQLGSTAPIYFLHPDDGSPHFMFSPIGQIDIVDMPAEGSNPDTPVAVMLELGDDCLEPIEIQSHLKVVK